ncbi:MAG: helix-turn-helix transcriptional regulator [Clostridia bacterium]
MLGRLIKLFLDENGIKYSFVANEIGIPANVFSTILNGKRKIIAEEYFAICAVLNVDTNYFAKQVSQTNQQSPTKTHLNLLQHT